MDKEIIEGNKLIAEFMGEVGLTKVSNDKIVPYDKRYNNTWQNLMPVIEKISKFKYEEYEVDNGIDDIYIEYDTAYTRTFGMINSRTGNPMVRINRHQLFEATTLIEAAWLAVVDFIKWYNNQTK